MILDKSYPLGEDYTFVAPVQPPINPNYSSYQQMQSQLLPNTSSNNHHR